MCLYRVSIVLVVLMCLCRSVCLMCIAEDKRGWMKYVNAIHTPKSRKNSYTRRATDAYDILNMEAEEWHKGAQTLQFNGWLIQQTKAKESK